jgi:Ca-activated chloride channel family protein
MTTSRRLAAAACLVAATSVAWLDPHQPLRDANKLYNEGKYDEAAAGYNAALVDHPDSADLHFNLGDAAYKQGNYEEAMKTFQQVETTGDPQRASRVAYNVGNATFRQGQALEQTDPQKALALYAESLASYRRALGLTPDDEDSKFNHELVTQRIADLKKRLEEQKKDQDQQKQDQQNKDQQQQDQQQQNQDEEKQDQQQNDQQQDQKKQDQAQDQQQKDDQQQPKQDEQQQQGQENKDQQQQQQDQQQAGGEQKDEQQQEQQPQDQQGQGEQQDAQPKPGDQQQPPPTGDAIAGEKKDGELSKGEAAAILDSQRGEEVSPEDVIKKLQGARVAEPAQDW